MNVLWFTGLSGAGKTTIAKLMKVELAKLGHDSYHLDGDDLRAGLNKDLGFTDLDRVENIRRAGEVSKLLLGSGKIVLSSFISPFATDRKLVKNMLPKGKFIEIFVDAPVDVCEKRDVKGLYSKARSGEVNNFTGIDSVYEAPKRPDIRLNTDIDTAEICVQKVMLHLFAKGVVSCFSSRFQ